jgi:hypothetical protein
MLSSSSVSQMKIFICCDVTESVFDIYVSWTAVGALGFMLALLCSVQLLIFKGAGGRRSKEAAGV